jgi:hypothetical protein
MSKKKVLKGSVKVGKRKQGVVFLSRPSTLSVIFSTLAIILIVAGLTVGGIPVVWMIWYRVSPDTSQALAQVLLRPVTGFGEQLVTSGAGEPTLYQPPVDPALPETNRIIIKSIGVDTAIVENPLSKYEDAFRQGVWRVPDFGTPYERKQPTILAAHRFGYLAWTNAYRRQNSFFNLPKLKLGDQVEIIWNQRRYLYEIYSQEEAPQITNYGADLILYTCKFLESDTRVFKYGRLIEKGYF